MPPKTDLILSAGCAVAICTFTGGRLDWWVYLLLWLLIPVMFNVRLGLARWGSNAGAPAIHGTLSDRRAPQSDPLQIG